MRTFVVTLLILGVAAWLATSALFTVDRAEFVYLTQFGRHVATYDGKTDAGLHIKWPWPIQSVLRLDSRLQFFDLREQELPTRDSESGTIDKMLTVSAYVCWRIAGSGDGQGDGVDQFVRTVSTPERARVILEPRVLSQLGAEVARVSLDDLISVAADKAVDQRMEQMRNRLLGTSGSLKQLARDQYGIELVDIRFRRFNYPPSVRKDIYERIVSEREKKVADYTSEGQKRAVDIESEARRQARDIETGAKAKKKRLEEDAAVKADAIRNEAHSKDPEFYKFLQKLEAYQTILGSGRDVLLLSSNHELFDLLLRPPPTYEPLPAPQSEGPTKQGGS